MRDKYLDRSNVGVTFWWATGQHLLHHGNPPQRQLSMMSAFLRSTILFKQQAVGMVRGVYHNSIVSLDRLAPANYVDNASPIASPCLTGSSDGHDVNGTKASCKLYVFHHLYIDNNWKEIIVDQLAKLVFSGVYDRATAVYSTISGHNDTEMTAAEHLLTSYGSKFRVLDRQINSTLYERLTMYQIKSHVSTDDIILYIHSKGESH